MGGGNDLALWAIWLSECRAYLGLHGRIIIYDWRTKNIIQWPNNEPGYTNTYLDLTGVPADAKFSQWIRFLRELKEVTNMTVKSYQSLQLLLSGTSTSSQTVIPTSRSRLQTGARSRVSVST